MIEKIIAFILLIIVAFFIVWMINSEKYDFESKK